ncbi:MAG TPA: cellulose biosynthesis protein BcsS [Hyphomicrobiaceae bacterium]|nr:cellulose biosynthesis protein BcsS [Hyphomicrobiaceae bacterium]
MRGVGGRIAIAICRVLAVVTPAAAGLPAWTSPVAGETVGAQADEPRPHFEFWVGASAFRNVWSIYSGTTVAPFGSVQEDGARLRLTGGYGEDRYSSQTPAGSRSFRGRGSFADLLIGYHAQLGNLTLKAFAGPTLADRQTTPSDPATTSLGMDWGGKAVLETWWNIGERTWTAVDLSWASLHDSYSARVRLGWRLTPAISIGVEASAVGSEGSDIAGAGGFLRYETATGELSFSGGVTNDRLRENDGGLLGVTQSGTPIATVSWLTRF